MPPVATTVAVPRPPLQVIFTEVIVIEIAVAGWLITTDPEFVQPLLSVTVTVYVPAVKPVAVAVP